MSDCSASSGEWAAWVQAVGSIVAIVAAAWIAIWQSQKTVQHATELKASEEREKINAFQQIVRAAWSVQARHRGPLLCCRNKVVGDRRVVAYRAEAQCVEKALSSVDIHVLPAEVIGYTISIIAGFARFRVLMEKGLETANEMSHDEFHALTEEIIALNAETGEMYREIEGILSKTPAFPQS
ncbi:hypothetical protein [Caballeronia sp. AZ1_KS37]|uniref:hypothetical protein n=1 Tax=Caballeronia sp. AZ1_KS37 TaxID=2921756 RepID=UPI002028FF69|nr:hypothetical protein [Caballeronia sp. AZ1_KS37]